MKRDPFPFPSKHLSTRKEEKKEEKKRQHLGCTSMLALRRRLFSTTFLSSALALPRDFGVAVFADFFSPAEEAALEAALRPLLGRREWEEGHWDNVIRHYRESELPLARLPPACAAVVARAHARFPRAGGAVGAPLPALHALELAPRGCIDAHVDSIKFSGGVVAGLCLRSDAVMLLTPAADAAARGLAPSAGGAAAAQVEVWLPRRCLYLLTGEARYGWGHAIPLQGSFGGRAVERDPAGRLSIMLRDALPGGGGGAGAKMGQ